MGLSVDGSFAGYILFKNMWVLKAPWGCLLLFYLMVMFFKEYEGPQCTMGLHVDVVFAVYICK